MKWVGTYILNASAGEEGIVDAIQVPSGRKIHITRVTFYFPSGSNYLLEVALYLGETKALPDVGTIVGDTSPVSVGCDLTYQSGEYIKVYYKNNDGTNAHKCFIVMEGEVI